VGLSCQTQFLTVFLRYVIDAFTLHAASALAAVAFLRSICGFGFPLFAPAMYKSLGYGTGDSILAVVAIVVGCPALVVPVRIVLGSLLISHATGHISSGCTVNESGTPVGTHLKQRICPAFTSFTFHHRHIFTSTYLALKCNCLRLLSKPWHSQTNCLTH
jgi:hypothetical protein